MFRNQFQILYLSYLQEIYIVNSGAEIISISNFVCIMRGANYHPVKIMRVRSGVLWETLFKNNKMINLRSKKTQPSITHHCWVPFSFNVFSRKKRWHSIRSCPDLWFYICRVSVRLKGGHWMSKWMLLIVKETFNDAKDRFSCSNTQKNLRTIFDYFSLLCLSEKLDHSYLTQNRTQLFNK